LRDSLPALLQSKHITQKNNGTKQISEKYILMSDKSGRKPLEDSGRSRQEIYKNCITLFTFNSFHELLFKKRTDFKAITKRKSKSISINVCKFS